MKRVLKVLSLSLILSVIFAGCSSPGQDTKEQNGQNLTEITLILDYTPNTNHTGLYAAKNLGYYEDQGLDVTIIEPDDTAAALVAAGRGQFGVSYQEDVTYALTSKDPLPIKTIAAIVQHNTSGFVSLKDAGISSPADFVGKTYAGWGAPSEEAVISAVMKKSGVKFDNLEDVINIVGADGSGFASLSSDPSPDKVNIQWEFEGWAVTKGLMDGYDLNYIPLRDLDESLDYYTPVIITNTDMIENSPETVRAFMVATKKGYEYAIENPSEAAKLLSDHLPDSDMDFLIKSQEFLSSQYSLDSDTWGVMSDQVWDRYTQFMYDYGLIDKMIDAKDQYTNEFIR